ncbi:unnamed protein product [Danaus chrysippus]|uniref:Ribosome biogenesis protein NOP53 n=1 Tax=Danaus chrysippus TaxID=151541 RepID=A0A8J2QQM8_9NEOP|nr:unnamed protein product [Danaus chrysippus]
MTVKTAKTTATKKRKRVSKKSKASWRKHCDINDVEEFLEDQRLEERLGKFDEKPDEELFIVDTTGGDVDEKPEVKPDLKAKSFKERKRAQLAETPKCFEVLLPTSKVQDPNKKRNTVKQVGSKPSDLSKLTEKRQLSKGVLSRKLEQTKVNRKLAIQKKKKSKTVRQSFDKNIWDAPTLESKGIPETLCNEFVSTEAQLHNVPTTKRIRAKPQLPKTLLTRAAIEVPHPGVSYNPSYQEHQALLSEVVQHEQKMMKRQAHLNRVTTNMFSKVTQGEKEKQWQEEMSVGLPQPHNPSNDPDPEPSDNEYKAVNPPVKNKKKDHKARRKQREQLEEKERLKRAKIEKKKITDLYRLRKIQESLKKQESRQCERSTRLASKREEKAATALPALNKHRPPEKEPEFVDPAILTGDLRNLTNTSNLLRDRFESLQRRGALAASKVMMKKKRKLKSYFKPGHKVTEQDIKKYIQKLDKK